MTGLDGTGFGDVGVVLDEVGRDGTERNDTGLNRKDAMGIHRVEKDRKERNGNGRDSMGREGTGLNGIKLDGV